MSGRHNMMIRDTDQVRLYRDTDGDDSAWLLVYWDIDARRAYWVQRFNTNTLSKKRKS